MRARPPQTPTVFRAFLNREGNKYFQFTWTFNNQNSIYSMQFCSIFGAVLRVFLSCGIVVLLNQAGIYKFSGTAISMRFEVFLCYSVRFCGIVVPLYAPLRGSRLGPGRPCSHNSGTTSYFSGKPDTDLIIF